MSIRRVLFGAAPLLALALAGCGGGAPRSPDLPPAQFKDFALSCAPGFPITVGSTSQCRVSNCRYELVDADGKKRDEIRDCPEATWSSSKPEVARIDNSGQVTGVSAGTAQGTVTVDGIRQTFPVQVNDACIQSLRLSPENATTVAGKSLSYTAIATYDDGAQRPVTSATTFASNTAGVTFGSGVNRNVALTDKDLPSTVTAGVTGAVSSNTCSGNPVTGTTDLTVDPATLVGICLQNAGAGFTGCRPDSGTCQVPSVTLQPNQTRALLLRARFNNGLECNVTTESSSTFSSSNPSAATVDQGQVTAVAPGTASISSTHTHRGTTQSAPVVPVTVQLPMHLGSNSLTVSAKSLEGGAPARKLACVGANDVVAALSDSSLLQGRQTAFAGARYCTALQLANGRCTGFIDPNPQDVSNDDGTTNRIKWTAAPGYWDGAKCATTLPTNPLPGKGSPAVVGDAAAPPGAMREIGHNGIITATGTLRVGFSCVVAEYTSPHTNNEKAEDGLTVLVLPVTNDVLLGPSSARDATELCDALEPLFQLGAAPNGGNGAPVRLLSALTEIVNPILQNVAQGSEAGDETIPSDDVVAAVVEGLSDNATAAIFAAGLGNAVAQVDASIYKPLTCGLRALLTALVTQNSGAAAEAQACMPPR